MVFLLDEQLEDFPNTEGLHDSARANAAASIARIAPIEVNVHFEQKCDLIQETFRYGTRMYQSS